ncbi:hypothetical protein HN587_01155 [Candidatus Woesearchaeota archaeon]|jgi:hypothetical protein|nr:hypothetical protein [Candidatus Woesearchaeota archaeon]
MNVIQTLEKRLDKLGPRESKRELLGVYKQLAVSHKGRQTNGPYRRAVEDQSHYGLMGEVLVDYVVEKLTEAGLTSHAKRLKSQYGVKFEKNYFDFANSIGDEQNPLIIDLGDFEKSNNYFKILEPGLLELGFKPLNEFSFNEFYNLDREYRPSSELKLVDRVEEE